MPRLPLLPLSLTVPAFLLPLLADTAAVLQAAGRPVSAWPDLHPSLTLWQEILLVHAAASLAAAVTAACLMAKSSFSARLAAGSFLLVLCVAMPGLGILLAAALGILLHRPSRGGLRPEERFVFGNPEAGKAARLQPRPPGTPPLLTPLAETFRDMDPDLLCQALLGLRHLQPPAAVRPFLLRFQQDPRTNVQFTAQAVLSGRTENLENAARLLRTGAAGDPGHPEARLALASVLERLALQAPAGDSTAAIQRRQAAGILTGLCGIPDLRRRVLPLLARLQAAMGDGSAALLTATRWAEMNASGDPAMNAVLLESLYHQRRWDDLAAAARHLPAPHGLAECHAFWAHPHTHP